MRQRTNGGSVIVIQIIFGEKGTGKTKRILDLANRLSKEAKGSTIFLDDDNSYMYDLDYAIRFVNTTEYGVVGPKMFYGFLCGFAASDYDLEYIFVDAFLKQVRHDLSTLEDFFDQLKSFSDQHGIHIVLSVSGSANQLPSFLQDMVM